MKKEIFDYYASAIAKQFNITLKELFTQTKLSHIVDARQLLYLLCVQRNFKKSYIKNFLSENGYVVSHSTIKYGVEQAEKLIESDPDFALMLKNIQKNDN
jgi:chromosomal replication initiation ATPase DnaA